MSIAYAQISESDSANGKFSARMTLADAILADFKSQHTSIKMLTMPGAWWHFERNYLPNISGMGFSVTGCERNKDIFEVSNQHKPISNRFKLVNCDIADYMHATSNKFDVVWLDYCGIIHDNLINGLIAVKKVLKHNSLLAITITAHRERDIFLDMIRERKGSRVKLLTDLVQSLVSSKLKLISTEKYCDSRSPMVQVIFKRS